MSVELAERILRGEQYQTPEGGEGGRTLLRLAMKEGPHGGPSWFAAIADADTSSIIAAIASLGSPGVAESVGSNVAPAYRDAARAMVERKLTERMVAKMDALERASNRLALVGIGVAVVIAVVEIWAAR